MQITLSLTTVRRLLVALLGLLICAGLLAELWDGLAQPEDDSQWVAFFSLSYEENLPTWFSSGLLLACALVLASIAVAKREARAPYVGHWWGLAAAFLYISLDEIVQLHEHASAWFDVGGVLYFSWVIPGAIVVALFALSYWGFLAHLPRSVRHRFVLAGAIYVGGALGLELPLGYWTERAGNDNLTYGMIDLVEESLEMIGASLFLYSLLQYLAAPSGVVRISVKA